MEEPPAINVDETNRTRHLFVDNCSGHKLTDAIRSSLEAINTEFLFMPPNKAHLCQPFDSSIIQKLKAVRRREQQNKEHA